MYRQHYNRITFRDNKTEMVNVSKEYESILNEKLNNYKQTCRNKITNMRTKNPNGFWDYINSLDSKTNHDYLKLNFFALF